MTQHILCLALSALLVALSVPAAAQQPQNIPRIGYLCTRPADMEQILRPAFLHGLRELVAALVRLKVDVIVVIGPDVTAAAKEGTTTTPIVFISPDPVGLGLVASLAHPGGNVTGLSDFHGPLGAKRLELLKEVVPPADGSDHASSGAVPGG